MNRSPKPSYKPKPQTPKPLNPKSRLRREFERRLGDGERRRGGVRERPRPLARVGGLACLKLMTYTVDLYILYICILNIHIYIIGKASHQGLDGVGAQILGVVILDKGRF